MTLNAASELQFSSPAGEANYRAARRRYPAQAIVDLATLRDNMAHLVDVVGGPHSGTAVMGVVKADAYGHGLLPAALAALAGGATWLGTAQSHEALLLRKLGIGPDRCRILTWVYNGMDVPFDELIDNDIDISVGSLAGVDALANAARRLGKPARVHVKVDSGFGRNGFTPAGFDAALAKLVPLAHEGVLHIAGSGAIWRSPTRRMCLNSSPPPTGRSNRSRNSPVAWKPRASRPKYAIWQTPRPRSTVPRFISN